MSLNPSMIEKVSVDDFCLDGFPCRHHFKITLKDGRVLSVKEMDGIDIYCILRSIVGDQFEGSSNEFKESRNHFHEHYHPDYEFEFPGYRLPRGIEINKRAAEALTDLFKKAIKAK